MIPTRWVSQLSGCCPPYGYHFKKELKILRVNLWGFDIMDIYDFLSQEGYDSICQEFEKETTDYLRTYRMEMED